MGICGYEETATDWSTTSWPVLQGSSTHQQLSCVSLTRKWNIRIFPGGSTSAQGIFTVSAADKSCMHNNSQHQTLFFVFFYIRLHNNTLPRQKMPNFPLIFLQLQPVKALDHRRVVLLRTCLWVITFLPPSLLQFVSQTIKDRQNCQPLTSSVFFPLLVPFLFFLLFFILPLPLLFFHI